MTETGPALEITNLTKHYKTGFLHRQTRTALAGVSLDVRRGEIFGYLGPNGSGKTTTLKLVLGLLFPDAGSISVLGMPWTRPEWRSRVGYLPEHPYLYDYLTSLEYLDYAGRLSGVPPRTRRERAQRLLETMGLARSASLALRRFSKGMLQRVGIAQALVGDPDLVFLDEPMSGLDPIGRRLVRSLILQLKEQGKTVFFSTHILSDAETLCDRVAVLRGGRLLKMGRLDEILSLDVTHMEVLVTGLESVTPATLPRGVSGHHRIGERWRLEVEEAALGEVIRAVEAHRGRVLAVQPIRQSLEDYFFKEIAPEGLEAEGQWVLEE